MMKDLLYGLLILATLISVAIAANTSPTTYYQLGPTKFDGPVNLDGNPIVDASNITASHLPTTEVVGLPLRKKSRGVWQGDSSP